MKNAKNHFLLLKRCKNTESAQLCAKNKMIIPLRDAAIQFLQIFPFHICSALSSESEGPGSSHPKSGFLCKKLAALTLIYNFSLL